MCVRVLQRPLKSGTVQVFRACSVDGWMDGWKTKEDSDRLSFILQLNSVESRSLRAFHLQLIGIWNEAPRL